MSDIKGNNIGAPITPFTTEDIYPTHLAEYGKGGLRTVPDMAALNAIISARREWFMEVVVEATGKKYKLTKGLVSNVLTDNGNWKEVVESGETYDNTANNTRLTNLENNKVDKVTGKSLLSDTEIARLLTLTNFDNSSNNNRITSLENKVDNVGDTIQTVTIAGGILTIATDKGNFTATIPAPASGGTSTGGENVASLEVVGDNLILHTDQDNYSVSLASFRYNDTAIKDRVTALENKPEPQQFDNTSNANRLTNLENNKVDKVAGSGLMTDAEKAKLAGLQNFDNTTNNTRITALENKPAGEVYNDSELRGRIQLVESDLDAVETEVIAVQNEVNGLEDRVEVLENRPISSGTTYDDTILKNRLTAVETDVGNKVSKVDGKNLIAESEIQRLSSVFNYNNTTNDNRLTILENKVSEQIGVNTFLPITSNPYLVETSGAQSIPLPADTVYAFDLKVLGANNSGVRGIYQTHYQIDNNQLIISPEAKILGGDEISYSYLIHKGTGNDNDNNYAFSYCLPMTLH
ncbi:hypothetical protein F1C16_05230 [Hymenobacter sp. NBH84]|uniref:hypothetical protein n=1 Tax=Hymenobacter sp. NBH84 TaxID=2596915 RepID=UPI0016285D33|nr:hypothetical protein [Hymenobacter sp. NBH84]QNE38998.1 hypothetical protein F1C16_05230 [Hymenobacter sp. NBH84]